MEREEAIKILDSRPYTGEVREALEILIPELKESEDERIIKTLQEYVKNRNWMLNGPTQKDCLAWLEKQKDHFRDDTKMVEPKPAEWCEEDEVKEIIQQEQPEMDLEKEYQEFCKDCPFPWSSQYVNREYIDELCLSVARHFYKLGIKTRRTSE